MAMLPTLLVSCQTGGELSWNTIAVISKLDCDARRPELTVRAKKLKAAREVTSSTTSNRTRDKGGADITLAYNFFESSSHGNVSVLSLTNRPEARDSIRTKDDVCQEIS